MAATEDNVKAEETGTVDRSWRLAEATALDARVRLMDDWDRHTAELSEMLEQRGEKEHPTMLRSTLGQIRSLRDEFVNESQKLRMGG